MCQVWTFGLYKIRSLRLPSLAYQPVSMDWIWSVFGSHRWIFRPQMSTNNRDRSDSSHTGPSPIRAFALTTHSTLTEAIFISKLKKSQLVQESRTTKRSVTRSIWRGQAGTKTTRFLLLVNSNMNNEKKNRWEVSGGIRPLDGFV